jgi:hypothetical protein
MPTASGARGRAALVTIAGELAVTSDAPSRTEASKALGTFLEAGPALAPPLRRLLARALVFQPDTPPLQILQPEAPCRSRKWLGVLIPSLSCG